MSTQLHSILQSAYFFFSLCAVNFVRIFFHSISTLQVNHAVKSLWLHGSTCSLNFLFVCELSFNSSFQNLITACMNPYNVPSIKVLNLYMKLPKSFMDFNVDDGCQCRKLPFISIALVFHSATNRIIHQRTVVVFIRGTIKVQMHGCIS